MIGEALSPLGEAALGYACRGWAVFPCAAGSKRPATPHGFKDATLDPNSIRAWWTRMPAANIGMPTGPTSVDVLDIDVREDGDGWAATARLARAGLLAGANAMVSTRAGGLHLYFRPSGQPAGRLPLHHLDFKADGGYVVMPPSIVPPGCYEFVEQREDAAGTLDWAAVCRLVRPRHLARREPWASAEPKIEYLTDWLTSSRVVEGGRNAALYWACHRAIDGGVSSLAELRPLVEAAMTVGLPFAEASATAASALTRRRGTP